MRPSPEVKFVGRAIALEPRKTRTVNVNGALICGPNYMQPLGLCQAINLLNESKRSFRWLLLQFSEF
jgi:hypothetical protein